MRTLVALLAAMRPKQWVKNLMIAGPLLFGMHLFDAPLVARTALAVVVFSLAASGIYLVNDWRDLESDRVHPLKRLRPIASGRLAPGLALAAAGALVAGGLCAAWLLEPRFAYVLCAYVCANLAYSFGVKHVVLLDVMVLASGFVLRVLAGGYVVGVVVSEWMLMCTILLALFLGFAKRRHELTLMTDEAASHRKVLDDYSPYLLDQLILVVAACTVMSYALYTVNPQVTARLGNHNLIFTVPFVLYGVFRYLYLVHEREGGGDPTQLLLTDPPILVNVALWAMTCALVLYTA